ncbi:MAG: hypothetical protein Q7S30_06335, partial [Candidatus Omnitrophota bacterium]|nr:hypothetical protein [Candidatus Omnitrophota bacterium]
VSAGYGHDIVYGMHKVVNAGQLIRQRIKRGSSTDSIIKSKPINKLLSEALASFQESNKAAVEKEATKPLKVLIANLDEVVNRIRIDEDRRKRASASGATSIDYLGNKWSREELSYAFNTIWSIVSSQGLQRSTELFYGDGDTMTPVRAAEFQDIANAMAKEIGGVKVMRSSKSSPDWEFSFDTEIVKLRLSIPNLAASLVSKKILEKKAAEMKGWILQQGKELVSKDARFAETILPLMVFALALEFNNAKGNLILSHDVKDTDINDLLAKWLRENHPDKIDSDIISELSKCFYLQPLHDGDDDHGQLGTVLTLRGDISSFVAELKAESRASASGAESEIDRMTLMAGQIFQENIAIGCQLFVPQSLSNQNECDGISGDFNNVFKAIAFNGNKDIARSIIDKVTDKDKAIALITIEMANKNKGLLEDLKNAGIRFLITRDSDINELKGLGNGKKPYLINTFATMLIARSITADTPKDSTLRQLLGYYLQRQFDLDNSITVDDYINAIATMDIAKLIKGYLAPIKAFRGEDLVEKHHNIAATLISA